MFALLGLGAQEILLLAILGGLLVGVPVVICIVVVASRSSRQARASKESDRDLGD
jgi:hypothetical protein